MEGGKGCGGRAVQKKSDGSVRERSVPCGGERHCGCGEGESAGREDERGGLELESGSEGRRGRCGALEGAEIDDGIAFAGCVGEAWVVIEIGQRIVGEVEAGVDDGGRGEWVEVRGGAEAGIDREITVRRERGSEVWKAGAGEDEA